MKLFVIIPAYNEEKSIIEVINRIPSQIEGIVTIKIVVIDDGSTDNMVKLIKSETEARVISHECNKGVGAAFHTGINYVLKNKADIVVNIDADGQFDPVDIPKLIKPIMNNQVDFVTASRFIDSSIVPNMTNLKKWGNKQVSRLVSLMTGRKFYDVSCGFRAYNKEALLNLNLFGQFTYVQETFLELYFKNLRIKEIPIKVKYFSDRKSRIYQGAFHYANNTLKIILKTLRDYRPLKFFGFIGLSVLVIGLFFDVFILIFYFKTGLFSPYKSVGLAGIFLNIVGLSIIFLALVADMFYRIRMNQEKMLYFEKERRYYS